MKNLKQINFRFGSQSTAIMTDKHLEYIEIIKDKDIKNFNLSVPYLLLVYL